MSENLLRLFVYGSLKPGELGFEQIENLVSNHSPAELKDYALYVRDGLPVISKPAPGDIVRGVLLNVKPMAEAEFWRVVTEYEGTTNYKLDRSIKVISGDKELIAAAFIGRKMGKGNPEKLDIPWTSKLDPIFSQSFPLLHRDISTIALRFTDAEYDPIGYWNQMNRLLSQYLLLVSIMEHLTVVKFGGSKKQEPMVRIRKFQDSHGYSRAFNALDHERYNPQITVSDSRAVEDSLSSSNPHQALLAWYQVRSNLQHRGKASLFDANLVHKSCIGLGNFLFEYMRLNIDGIENEWLNLLKVNLAKNEFTKDFYSDTPADL